MERSQRFKLTLCFVTVFVAAAVAESCTFSVIAIVDYENNITLSCIYK